MAIRTVEATVQIGDDRKLVVQLPADIPIGTHRVVAVLEEASIQPNPRDTNRPGQPWSFPVIPNASWPADMPLTREEMYGDDGR